MENMNPVEYHTLDKGDTFFLFFEGHQPGPEVFVKETKVGKGGKFHKLNQPLWKFSMVGSYKVIRCS